MKNRHTPRIAGISEWEQPQERVELDTVISELSRWAGAPLQEISINDAQTRLMSKISKRNMARKVTEVFTLINHR